MFYLRSRKLKLNGQDDWRLLDQVINQPTMDVQAITHFTKQVFAPTLTAHVLLALSLAFVPSQHTHLRSTISVIIAAICMETIRR